MYATHECRDGRHSHPHPDAWQAPQSSRTMSRNGSGSAAASVDEYIEILNAEQHVDLDKLRDYARHGCQPQVRGEVWLYLLGVLADDKSQEMTSVRSKFLEYEQLDKHHPALEKRIRGECARYYQRRLVRRAPLSRGLARSAQRIPQRPSSQATSGMYAMPWQENHHPYHQPNANLQSATNSNPSSTSRNERGPNRIDGALANARVGIMGGVGSLGILAADYDEDPAAAAGEELKRFCGAVGNIVCAHLNRWDQDSGRSVARQQSAMLPPFKSARSESGSGYTSSGSEGDGPLEDMLTAPATSVRRGEPQQGSSSGPSSHSTPESGSSRHRDAGDVRPDLHTPSEVAAAAASDQRLGTSALSGPSSASSQSGDQLELHDRYNSNSDRPSNAATARASRPGGSLPREYEWAHSGPAIALNTTTAFDGVNGNRSFNSIATADCSGHRFGEAYGSSDEVLEGLRSTSPQAILGSALAPNATFQGFSPDLVFLCAPFVKCVRVEAGMFFAFEKLMSMIEKHNAQHPLPAQVSGFLTLFRTTLPDLYAYFEEEEVDVVAFATSWLRHLLAGEMQIDDLLRLWDTYFAIPDPLDLHLFVCIAILTNCKDALEELDQSEAKSMLYSLPPLDVDRILHEARNIQVSVRQSQAGSY